jgi:tetratricopeptide (TPR) repeat protein
MANPDSGTTGPELLERAMEGFELYEQGDYANARDIFEELSEKDPAEAYYRTALGAIFLAEDELEAALENFNLALTLNAKDSAALVNRGRHLRRDDIRCDRPDAVVVPDNRG